MTTTKTLIFLAKGAHTAESGQKCVNEFGAWVAGEPHSDMPHCFSPVITRFMMGLNDRLPDDLRQQLLPMAIAMVGTNTGRADDTVRGDMLADWSVRVAARYWFAEAGRPDWCARVDALEPLTSKETCRVAANVLREIKAAAAASASASAYAYAYAAYADAAYAYAAYADAASASAAYAYAAYAAYASAASAAAYADAAAAASADAAKQRKAWGVLLPSALELLTRLAAVGRRVDVDLIEDRATMIREACHV